MIPNSKMLSVLAGLTLTQPMTIVRMERAVFIVRAHQFKLPLGKLSESPSVFIDTNISSPQKYLDADFKA